MGLFDIALKVVGKVTKPLQKLAGKGAIALSKKIVKDNTKKNPVAEAIDGGELDNVTVTAKKSPAASFAGSLKSLPPWALPVGGIVAGIVVLKAVLK